MSLIKQKETEYWDMYNIRQQLVNQLTAMGVTASTSETVTSLINKVSSISLISTTINLSLSTSSIHYGGSVTATITLDDTSANALSNREVILYNGTTEVGRATTSDTGSATITFKADTVGSNSYTAKFLGKAQYKYSTSTAQTLTVAKADTVITLTASPTTVTSGSSTTLTVTLKDEWGNNLNGETVQILSGATELYSGIIANNTYSSTYSPIITISLKSSYTGSTSYNNSTSANITINYANLLNDTGSTSGLTNYDTSISLGGSATTTLTYDTSKSAYKVVQSNSGSILIPIKVLTNYTDDFTLEFDIQRESVNGYAVGVGHIATGSTGNTLQIRYNDTVFLKWNGTSWVADNSSSCTVTNSWYHAKLVKSGNNYTYTISLNGTTIRTETTTYTDTSNYNGIAVGWINGATAYYKNVIVKSN